MTRACFWSDHRGAVLAEFAVVAAPVILGFLGTWQLAELYATHLVVKRAVSAAARAAVVVLPDDPRWYDNGEVNVFAGQRREAIEMAAALVLVAAPAVKDFSVEVTGDSSKFNDITVTVTATASCYVFVCGPRREIDITASTTQAYHGAEYSYDL